MKKFKKENTKKFNSPHIGTRKILSVLISVLILSLGLSASALGADTEGVYESNRRLCETALENLGDAIEGYSNADPSENREISQKTSAAIIIYRRTILEIQSDPLFSSKTFESEILLAEAQGLAIGEATWTYRSRLYEYPSLSSSTTLTAKIEEISSEIASSSLATVLEANIAKYIVDINRTAFCELVRSEGKTGDSLAVNAIIEGSVNEINKLYSTDASGKAYREIYEKAKSSIALRRTKDKLTNELEAIYTIIKPDGDFSSDKHVALFVYQLEEKSTLEEMNSVLNNTISDLLDTLSVGKYTEAFIKKIKADVSTQTDAASQVNSIPALKSEFTDFNFGYAKASTKDKIAAFLGANDPNSDKEMKELENDYNRDGGIIDLCQTNEELSFEEKRAKLRADWYSEYKSACEDIKIIVAPHDASALLEQLKAEYISRDEKISRISHTEKNAEILTNAEFAKGVEGFEEIKSNAKIEKYKNDHSEIISKSDADIKATDAPKLKSAIEDAIKLENALLEKISDTTRELAKKYKLALKAELSERSFNKSSAHIWKNSLIALQEEIDSIAEALSISDFYATAKRISDRANTIEAILNNYTDIILTDEYKTFPDRSKTAFMSACTDAVQIILDVNITPISWTQRLSEAKASSDLVITKSYSAESLRAMASRAQSSEASPIAEEAAANIEKSLTEGEVLSLYQAAKFKLSRILNYEETLERAKALKKDISSLEYLTEERKNEFVKKISDNIDTLAEKIKISATSAYLENAYQEAKSFLDSVENDATGENLKAAKRLVEGQLATANTEHENAISSLTHATSKEKAALKEKLSELKAELLEKIDSAKSIDELNKVKSNMELSLGDFTSEIALTELNACRRDAKEAYEKILEEEEKYSVENYNLILSLTKDSTAFIDGSAEIEKILENQRSTLAAIEEIPDLLDTEKFLAVTSLDTLFNTMEARKSLYSKNNFDTLEKLHESAIQLIEAIDDFDDFEKVERLLSTATRDMTAIPMDKLYTADNLILSGNSTTKYPLGYSISEDGYPAFITAEGNIPYNSHLKLISIPSSDKQGLLRKLIRNDKAVTSSGAALSKDLEKVLKSSKLLLGFELDTSLEFNGTQYELTILLPDDINKEKIIGIVRLDGENCAEFYKFSVEGSLLTITVDSAGEFYLATEKNYLPLILAIILIILLLTPICIFLIRYMRNAGIPPFAPKGDTTDDPTLTSLRPISDSRELSPTEKPTPPSAPYREAKEEEFTNRTEEESSGQESKKESEKKESENDDEKIEIDEEILFGTLVGEYEPDRQIEKGNKKKANDTPSMKMHRAEINLDLLAKHFNAGDVVTLEDMIKKGLLSPDTTFVKVLARGKINKPLTVIAQDFSTAAMRMILLAGGNATITEEKLSDEGNTSTNL